MTRFLRLLIITVTLCTTAWLINSYARAPEDCHCPSVGELPPLNRPSLTTVGMLNWARDAAVLSFSYQHANITPWLQDYAQYFTLRGWTHYYNALRISGNMEKVKQEKIIVSATPLQPPKMLWQGVDLGVYTWHIQMPLLVQYERADGTATQQKLLVNMMLSRTDRGKNGVGIEQFIAKPL